MFAHRPAAVAGTFYPREEAVLRADVARYLAQAHATRSEPTRLCPKLIVVPHAGYMYSGPIAAHAYALLAPWRDRLTRVVLLGPAHRVAIRGLAVPSVGAFHTPLGAVPLDREAIAAITGLPQVGLDDEAHAREHALEVQLPFLQSVLGRFSLVPLAVGHASAVEVAEVLERLWGGEETLVVISSDLSHYLPYERARATDATTVDRMLRLDATIAHEQACGATPINGALRVARARHLVPRLLDLRNSGDTSGDRSRVVGYGAIVFEPAAAARQRDETADEADDDSALGRALTSRARNAIAQALRLARIAEPPHPDLGQPAASFVTLRRHGELRGCVGSIEAGEHSLEEDVRANARRAAFEDPRFAPLTAHEWQGLRVEVSLLTAPEPLAVRSEDEAVQVLRPGVDGVVLGFRAHRSTFLPQVWEQLDDARMFLAALKRKAGLAADFWHRDLELARYSVRKFTDDVSLVELQRLR
jgi:MEMO1 family protein